MDGETYAPRAAIQSAGYELKENVQMQAGDPLAAAEAGGRMWFGDEEPQQRISRHRAKEAADTGSKLVATACPLLPQYALGTLC